MPVTPTYPGVYVQEIASGVRTITGVATSITAFVGRALRGPVNVPVTINSFADFERTFGGLWADAPMTYAVRDFFLNGGGQAVIVRLYGAKAVESISISPSLTTEITTLVEKADKMDTLDAQRTFGAEELRAALAAQQQADEAFYEKQSAVEDTRLREQRQRATVVRLKQRLNDAITEAAAALSSLTAKEKLPDSLQKSVSGARDALDKARTQLATVEDELKPDSQLAKDIATVEQDRTLAHTRYRAIRAVVDVVTTQANWEGATPATVKQQIKQAFYTDNSNTIDEDKITALLARMMVVPETRNTKAILRVNDILDLVAASEGSWGNRLQASIDSEGINATVAERYPNLTEDDLFNLTVIDAGSDRAERFLNLTIEDGSPRFIGRVLQSDSVLVRLQNRPASKPAPVPQNQPTTVRTQDKASDGAPLDVMAYSGSQERKTGLYALDNVDLFNLLCIPPDTRGGDTDPNVYQAAMKYCADRRAMLIVDPPAGGNPLTNPPNEATLGLAGVNARNAALFFPRVRQADPLREGQIDTFAPCGVVAGVMARTDVQRGVWKAPAGIDAALTGVQGLEVNLTDAENGRLNPLGINCLRSFPTIGPVVWGARTLRGADQLADEYKYIPVRRLALYIEESLYRGMKWVVFEPNDEPLWSQIRLNVGAFMHNLFRQGAFQGKTPRDAYFVKCDSETTTQNDINLGIVNVIVGFAPLKPAEFVIISLQQIAGQIAA